MRGSALISLNGSSATGGSVLSLGYDPIVRASRVSELVCRRVVSSLGSTIGLGLIGSMVVLLLVML